ncbi:hypothetical protein [Actinoplanes sp. NPDC051411]|uniref:hypothetical protein n=1 Tax=Actinoplanes sp. NPDC051411 TaxID=3155522 RepID=UPI00341879FF
MSEGPATVRSFVLTATFTGAILAFAGTTLYWARVTDSVGTFYLVRLADLNRVEAPIAVVWLVLAAGGALAGRDASPWGSAIRTVTVVFATMGAFFPLGLTLAADGAQVLGHAAVTDNSALVRAERVLPDTGCLLFVLGLTLIAVGAGAAEVAARGVRLEASRPGGRPIVHRLLFVPALIVAVGAAAIPWYDAGAADEGGPPRSADVQLWLDVFRAGLAVCLVITALALIRRRQAPAFRLLGLIVGSAVAVMLLSGYVALWRQPLLSYATGRIGLGYHLGLVAMLLLTASFLALPPEVPAEQEVA